MLPLKDRLSEPDKAYLAGFFDGEGSVGLYNFRDRHEVTAMITNTDPRIMDWLLEKIGYGNVCTIRNNHHRRKHAVSHWRICGKPRVQDFLEAMVSYLIIKKDQANVLLDLWKNENPGKNIITQEVKSNRDHAMEQLKFLKTSHLELAISLPN